MEKTYQRNIDESYIWTIERNRVDGVFVDCDIGGRIFAHRKHNRHNSSTALEYCDTHYDHTDLMHECGSVC